MNIFYLHKDPSICAFYHCDKHVCKMIVETAQMLSDAHWSTGGRGPYKPLSKAHHNHPCTKWARQSIANYRWLAQLGFHLCNEYSIRYSPKVHKTREHIEWLIANEPHIHDVTFNSPPQCMPDECKQDDTVEAYRECYRRVKSRFAKWKLGNTPAWYKNCFNYKTHML